MKIIRVLICLIFGHKYRVVQKFGWSARRVKCDRCKGDWAIYDPNWGMYLPMPPSTVEWYGELERLYVEVGYKIKEPIL